MVFHLTKEMCIEYILDDIYLTMTAENIIVAKIGKDELLIPYIDDYVMLFDKQNKTLVVKNISGLLS